MAAKKTTKKSAPASVSATEFSEFKKSTESTQNQILDILERMQGKVVTPNVPLTPTSPIGATTGTAPIVQNATLSAPQSPIVASKEADAISANDVLLPHYQKLFEKYFDPADGFTARMSFPEVDEKGLENGGIHFTVCVPLKFSNTDDGYRKMYKQDLRTRALLPHNIAKGIDDWCKAVAKNLGYNRNIRTK